MLSTSTELFWNGQKCRKKQLIGKRLCYDIDHAVFWSICVRTSLRQFSRNTFFNLWLICTFCRINCFDLLIIIIKFCIVAIRPLDKLFSLPRLSQNCKHNFRFVFVKQKKQITGRDWKLGDTCVWGKQQLKQLFYTTRSKADRITFTQCEKKCILSCSVFFSSLLFYNIAWAQFLVIR